MTLAPLLTASSFIQVHTACAIAAVMLGALVLFRRKGTAQHKLMGRTWVALMLIVAISSLFINEIRLIGPFSPIHLFVILTFASIAQGIWHIRRGNVKGHKASMVSLYFAALGLAGAFTLLPGRRMHAVLFGADAGWPPSIIAIGIVLAAVAMFWRRLSAARAAAS